MVAVTQTDSCEIVLGTGFNSVEVSVDVDDTGVVDLSAYIAGTGSLTEVVDNPFVSIAVNNLISIDTATMRNQQIRQSTVTLELDGETFELTFNVELRLEDLPPVGSYPATFDGLLFRKPNSDLVMKLVVTAEGEHCFVKSEL